jgi:hypothetical protein
MIAGDTGILKTCSGSTVSNKQGAKNVPPFARSAKTQAAQPNLSAGVDRIAQTGESRSIKGQNFVTCLLPNQSLNRERLLGSVRMTEAQLQFALNFLGKDQACEKMRRWRWGIANDPTISITVARLL